MQITISLPEELWQKVRVKAENSGATLSGVIRVNLQEWINNKGGKNE